MELHHRRAGLQPAALLLSYLAITPNQGIEPCEACFGDTPVAQNIRHIAVSGIAPETQGHEPYVMTISLHRTVEKVGFEPTAFCVQNRRSP